MAATKTRQYVFADDEAAARLPPADDARFLALATHAPMGIFQCDLNGAVQFANERGAEICGLTPRELANQGWQRCLHPDDRAKLLKSWRRALVDRTEFTAEHRLLHVDNSLRWVRIHFFPFANSDQVSGFLTTVTDISEQKDAESRLWVWELRFRRLTDAVRMGTFLASVDGRITFANPQLVATAPGDPQEMFGVGWLQKVLCSSDIQVSHSEIAASTSQALRAEPTVRQASLSFLDCEGRTRWAEVRCSPLIGPDGRLDGYVGTVEDTTERLHSEQMRHESEKVVAAARLAPRLAHEINNPLSGIKNSFLLVKEAVPVDHKYFPYVARIEGEIDRLARLARQFFGLYRPDSSAVRDIRLQDLIGDVLAMLETTARSRQVTLALDAERIEGPIRLHEDSLRQVIYNIVLNAIEASLPGGVVQVEARLDGSRAVVLVTDHGHGITPQSQPHIFQPHFTTKNRQESGGMGLGLSISRTLVETMQGSLGFDSKPGMGTVFRISIPPCMPPCESRDG